MLDERLIGTEFKLPQADTGTITLYGIHYHYRVVGTAKIGEPVVVVTVSPLELTVRAKDQVLAF